MIGMIDRIGISVSGYAHSNAFHERVLAPFGGNRLVMKETKAESGGANEGAGFGDSKP